MQKPPRRAFCLDRDGVINAVVTCEGRLTSPRTDEEFQILPRVSEAIRQMQSAGFLVIVVTNQPEISRGLVERETVDRFHSRIRSELAIDDIRVCYHDTEDRCSCRKPEPGLLVASAKQWNIRLGQSFLVGDREKDIEAGRRAGCTTMLIRAPYNQGPAATPDFLVESLDHAVKIALEQTSPCP
ncbi:MAG: HAD family hydrolase [Acidobacteria bacterium]|nr:HAD family hydrolase [Acidobacteriota bacterium]